MPYTRHGHWYGPGEPTQPGPRIVARCGGPAICAPCGREANMKIPEAESTQPDPSQSEVPPPYYFWVDPIGENFGAICGNCKTVVLKIEDRMSIVDPVAVCGAHVCRPREEI